MHEELVLRVAILAERFAPNLQVSMICSACLYVCVCVCVCVCVQIHIHLFIHPSVTVSLYLSVCLSIYLFVCVSVQIREEINFCTEK